MTSILLLNGLKYFRILDVIFWLFMNKVAVSLNRDGLNVSELPFAWHDFIIKWPTINTCALKSTIETPNGASLSIWKHLKPRKWRVIENLHVKEIKKILMSYLKCARSKYYMQNYFEVNIIKFLKMTKLFDVLWLVKRLNDG